MGQEKDAPSVVFLPGAGDFSFTWGLVLPEVAGFARACSYDKAFEAWSDPGPLPRTLKQDAYELRLLLTRGGVKGPYVLVGASAGGPLARTFNREFPADVAGMVLVDARDADTVMGRMVDGKIVDYRVREESKGRPVPPVQTMQSNPPDHSQPKSRRDSSEARVARSRKATVLMIVCPQIFKRSMSGSGPI